MVIRPIIAPAPAAKLGAPDASIHAQPLDVWSAIAAQQRRLAPAYWLVPQPEHARLSGELAANFVSPLFPQLSSDIVRGIGLHDCGWSLFAWEGSEGEPPLMAGGKPQSFIEIAPPDFLRAWARSIARAEQESALSGIIVSQHFCALGRYRLNLADLGDEDAKLIHDFLRAEGERQERLGLGKAGARDRAEQMLNALQFCDVLSLYLCCGAAAEVEFPQPVAGHKIRLRPESRVQVLEPSPFQRSSGEKRTLELGVEARLYPSRGKPRQERIIFSVQ